MAQRNLIEGKFGQARNAYGLDRIPARLKATSEAWISAIFLLMNITALMRVLPDRSGSFLRSLLRMVRHPYQGFTDQPGIHCLLLSPISSNLHYPMHTTRSGR